MSFVRKEHGNGVYVVE